MDTSLISDLINRLHDWFFERVLTAETLLQVGIVAGALLLAWAAAPALRARHREWMQRRDRPLQPGTLRNATNVLILPAIWLVLLWMGVLGARALDYPNTALRIAGSLLTAWIVIRFAATLVRNPALTAAIATTAWTIAALSILGWLKPAMRVLDGIALNIGQLHVSVLTVIKGAVYLAVFLWLAGAVSRFIEDRLRHSPSLTPSAAVLTGKLVRIVLITAAFFLAVSTVGIDLTVFAVFGGALGVGIGFGLQKVVANFISGIILLLDRSIKPGDVVSIGDTYGWVKSLNARYVSLDTRDGIEHLIPNEELIIQRVENWSYSNNRVRIKVPVGVHYKSDVRQAMALCVEAASGVQRVLKEPPPICLLAGFGDSSVDMEVRMWIDDPQNGLSNVKSDVLLGIWDKFHEHGIEIPFPQRDLHIKSPLVVQQRGASADDGD